MDKPIYKSKKFLAYGFTAVLVFAALLMHADGVAEKLAEALMLGLPVLLGGQALVDHRVATSESASTSSDLQR